MSVSSPAGRIIHWFGRRIRWWQDTFWPARGSIIMRGLTAAAVIGASLVILPARLYPLHLLFAALAGLAVLWQRRHQGQAFLVGQALVRVGLPWLAGHLAFGPMSGSSLALALSNASS